MGLGLLHRAGSAREVRRRRERDAPVFRGGAGLHDGVFFAAHQLYGVSFTERPDLVAYHPDARVFEVQNDDGSPVGLYVLDLYTRDSKRGGAWMNPLVSQSRLLDSPVVVVNNLNVPKPASGRADAAELRRGQHLLPRVRACAARPVRAGDLPEVRRHECLPRLRGVPQPGERDVDAVARGACALRRSLRDRRAAAPGHRRRLLASSHLQRGFRDERIPWLPRCSTRPGTHLGRRRRSPMSPPSRPRHSRRVGLDNPAVPPRYSSTYFAHTFSGGYDAGYYSYIWSEVLDADTVEWFKENGGLTRENGDRFREPAARRRRLEGSAGGLPRLPRPRRRDRAAAEAPRAQLTAASADSSLN